MNNELKKNIYIYIPVTNIPEKATNKEMYT